MQKSDSDAPCTTRIYLLLCSTVHQEGPADEESQHHSNAGSLTIVNFSSVTLCIGDSGRDCNHSTTAVDVEQG